MSMDPILKSSHPAANPPSPPVTTHRTSKEQPSEESLKTEDQTPSLSQEEWSKNLDEAIQGVTSFLNKLTQEVETGNFMNAAIMLFNEMAKLVQQLAVIQAALLRPTVQTQAIINEEINQIKLTGQEDFKGQFPDDDDIGRRIELANLENNRRTNEIEKLKSFRDWLNEQGQKIQTALNTSDELQKNLLEFVQTAIKQLAELLSLIFQNLR